MEKTGEEWRPDFEQAMGETLWEYVCPPVPWEAASSQECCEVAWAVVGNMVTPQDLHNLSKDDKQLIAQVFGEDFECEPPSLEQVETAIAQTLVRWPVGSLGECDPSEFL